MFLGCLGASVHLQSHIFSFSVNHCMKNSFITTVYRLNLFPFSDKVVIVPPGPSNMSPLA